VPSNGPVAAEPPPIWLVFSKSDLTPRNESLLNNSSFNEQRLQFILCPELADKTDKSLQPRTDIHKYAERFAISAVTGKGVDELVAALSRQATQLLAGAESGLITRERHRRSLEQARSALARAESLVSSEDLLAEELRTAAAALGRLTGRVDVEDILDVIFRDFCIGK
jgi:tRNA U34 5-carboxymethylaminomethyl modifying GTPase MnmE/TrmE